MRKNRENNLNTFIGETFEQICAEWVKKKLYPEHLIGRWWDRQEEIDIAALDPSTQNLIIAEVKWSELNKSDIKKLFKELHRKAEFIMPPFKVVRFMIIVRSIKDKAEIRDSLEANYFIFDLEDLIQ